MNQSWPLKESLVALGLLALVPAVACGQLSAGRQTVVTRTVTSTAYLSGGVGADEREAMRRVAGEFPLRIEFSEADDRELVADVPVVILNAKGASVLELRDAGPLLYVLLPNGRYTVSARVGGSTETQEVTVAAQGTKDLQFHWKQLPRK